MSELVDTIAQALWKADDDAHDKSWGFVNMLRRGKYRHQAKAAIAVLESGVPIAASRVHVVTEGRPQEFWADEWRAMLQDDGLTLALIGWGDGADGQRKRAQALMADLKHAMSDVRRSATHRPIVTVDLPKPPHT